MSMSSRTAVVTLVIAVLLAAAGFAALPLRAPVVSAIMIVLAAVAATIAFIAISKSRTKR